jgi:peptide/nickel transport system substrate-binding protein
VVLNTRQPPFSSIKARQAVNYAIDRARIIRLLRLGPREAVPTCQILPAGFPGHQNYCPYTIGPKNGTWHGTDLALARHLVKASGAPGEPVTVWSAEDGPDKAEGAYLGKLLTRLGYQATVRDIPSYPYFLALTNAAHSKIQIGEGMVWGADFPTAADFFLPNLTCHSYADPSNTMNFAGFCDPQVDRLASQAQAAQLTDPAVARRLWAQVDRIVTDQAPWAPVLDASTTVFVSARVGNYQASPFYGPLLDQIWIR